MRILPLFHSLACSFLLAAAASAQNCSNTSTGRIPLTDLGTNTYQGFVGGLYGNGSATRPTAHEAAGLAIATGLQPRNQNGVVDLQNGRIVLLSIGMSNTTQEFSTWVPMSNADGERNPRVVVVDGAQGGQDAVRISDPNAAFWTNIDARLASNGVSAQQVAALWIKEAIAGPTAGFPAEATRLKNLLGDIVRITKQRYPNVALCYFSSRIYAGYATSTLNPEPYSYESGFSVKWLIDDQVAGQGNLNYDPGQGAVVAPWLSWGPYLWADGTIPRGGDGLTWVCSDFAADGTHPGTTGRQKVANMLNAHFRGDTTTRPWYLGGNGIPRAGILRYGVGCPGTNGELIVRYPTTPFLGNTNFLAQMGNARVNSPAALLLSAARANLHLAGPCTLLVDPAVAFVTLPTGTGTMGRGTFAFAIPNDLSLAGGALPTQWVVIDPQGTPWAGTAIALTDGAEWRFGVQ